MRTRSSSGSRGSACCFRRACLTFTTLVQRLLQGVPFGDLDGPIRFSSTSDISSFHFELSGRGFSFRSDEPLDMRLGEDLETSAPTLSMNIRRARWPRSFTSSARNAFRGPDSPCNRKPPRKNRIAGTLQLADIIAGPFHQIPPRPDSSGDPLLSGAAHRSKRRAREARRPGPAGALTVLKTEGRIGVISFHSLEDRIVKRFFRDKNKSCTCPPEQPICNCGGRRILEIITKKPIVPGEKERSINPPSRSAKFRVVVKLQEE